MKQRKFMRRGGYSRRDALRLGAAVGSAVTTASLVNIIGTKKAAAAVVMKLGSDAPSSHPYNTGLEAWKSAIESQTDGRVTITIYPDAQLGGEEDMTNGLKIGAIDGMFSSTGVVTPFIPEIGVFDLPFLFKDQAHITRAGNGLVATKFNARVEKEIAARILGWRCIGSRNMWNSKLPIKVPSDVKGLKMRTQTSKVQQATYLALDALPTPIPFVEVYTSLQTGVLDGADIGIADIIPMKFYEVTKYMSMTRHYFMMCPLYVSDRFLNKLDKKDQDIVIGTGEKALDEFENAANGFESEESLAFLRKKGMEIIDVDREPFAKMTASVISDNAESLGGAAFIDKLQAA